MSTRAVPLQRQGTQALCPPFAPHGYHKGSGTQPGTSAHRAAPHSTTWVQQGLIHPQHPPAPRGVHPAWLHPLHCSIPQLAEPQEPRCHCDGHSHLPWPERVVGESCHAGSVPLSGMASSVARRPAPPAPCCEFPSIFSPVINNSSGIRHQPYPSREEGEQRATQNKQSCSPGSSARLSPPQGRLNIPQALIGFACASHGTSPIPCLHPPLPQLGSLF